MVRGKSGEIESKTELDETDSRPATFVSATGLDTATLKQKQAGSVKYLRKCWLG
jgi:hypothetical protein